MKLKMNSHWMAGNSLNLKVKLYTPMNTIMSIASPADNYKEKPYSLNCKHAWFHYKGILDTSKEGDQMAEAAIAFYATTQHAGKVTQASAIRKFRIGQIEGQCKVERGILIQVGKVSHEDALKKAESEFEKYRIVQDRLFESDFDKMAKKLESGKDE